MPRYNVTIKTEAFKLYGNGIKLTSPHIANKLVRGVM